MNNYAVRNAICFQRSINILCKLLGTSLTVIEVTVLRICMELEDSNKNVTREQISKLLKKVDSSIHRITLHLTVNKLLSEGYISIINEFTPYHFIHYCTNDITRTFFNQLEKQLRKQRIMY